MLCFVLFYALRGSSCAPCADIPLLLPALIMDKSFARRSAAFVTIPHSSRSEPRRTPRFRFQTDKTGNPQTLREISSPIQIHLALLTASVSSPSLAVILEPERVLGTPGAEWEYLPPGEDTWGNFERWGPLSAAGGGGSYFAQFCYSNGNPSVT